MRKGISLIVLVITIIVMIIIAGAIIISLSNTNVIDKADEAIRTTNNKTAITLASLAKSEFIMEKGYTLFTSTEAGELKTAIETKLTSGKAEEYEVSAPIAEDLEAEKTYYTFEISIDGEVIGVI